MITVYGRASSSNVQIVMWTLAELGLEAERLDYGHSFGGVDTPEYIAMNPMGTVPVLRDGDHVMFESAAIMRYLAARYGAHPFWPDDPAHRGRLDMWAEWVKTEFGPAFGAAVFWPLVRTAPADRNEAAVAAAQAKLARLAKMIDARIGAGPWMDGDWLTFADILIGYNLFRYYTIPFDRAETPHLDAYYQRLTERTQYRDNVMISFEALKAPGA